MLSYAEAFHYSLVCVNPLFVAVFFFLSGFSFANIETPLYHFHPLHGHVYIMRAVSGENSSLHIDRSRLKTEIFGFRAQDTHR